MLCFGGLKSSEPRGWIFVCFCVFGVSSPWESDILRYTLLMNIMLYMVGRWRYIAYSC